MARVPTGAFPKIGAPTEAAPYSRVNPTAAAFGALTGQAQANLGNAVAELGDVGGKILLDINKENLQRQAKYADNEYSNAVRTALYGDGTDQNRGLMNLQGQEAVSARAGVMQSLAEARARISDSLDNQIAKDMFYGSANERDDVALKNTTIHVAEQRRIANDTASNIRQDSAFQDGALGSADPDTVHQNEIIVQQEATSRAMAKGLDGKAVLDYTKQQVSKYYEAVITNRMETNTDAAKEMLTRYSDRIGGIEASILTKRLEAKERDDLSRAWAMEDHAHTQRVRYQDENFSKLVSDVHFKGAGLLEIQKALDAQKINGQQAENLVAQYQNKVRGGPGDPRRANELKYNILTGRASLKDVALDRGINEAERSDLMTIANTVANNGGVLAMQSVQDGQKTIDVLVANKTSMLKDIDDVAAARLTVATQAYKMRVLATPAEQLTPVTVDTIAREVASAYLAPTITDPMSILPPTPYWETIGHSDKASLTISLQQSAYKLLRDRSKISPQEFAEQGRVLRLYQSAISGMSDKPTVINPTTK